MTAPNPMIGEAEFRGLKLKMDFDRWCALENVTGKKMQALCNEFAIGLGLNDLRDWLRVFAVGNPTDSELTGIIHQGGMIADYAAANAVIDGMMKAFFAPPKEDAPPQKAE